jgi:hypothetical protein
VCLAAIPCILGQVALAGTPTVGVGDEGAGGLYTLTPCRLVDTRVPFLFPGPLQAGVPRSIQVAGLCGVPLGAKAAVLNATVVAQTATGNCRLYPDPELPVPPVPPLASSINFVVDGARANNAVVGLGPGGKVIVYCSGPPTLVVHLILDVGGYFD